MMLLPNRAYADDIRIMRSWRVPKKLADALTKMAKKSQWTVSDIVITALDLYLQAYLEEKNPKVG